MTELSKSTPLDKLTPLALIVLMLALFASVTFMVWDSNKRKEELWQADGCQMYDNYRIKNVPAKCHQHFIERYQSQEKRVQPPDVEL
jgi:hypothetical protein